MYIGHFLSITLWLGDLPAFLQLPHFFCFVLSSLLGKFPLLCFFSAKIEQTSSFLKTLLICPKPRHLKHLVTSVQSRTQHNCQSTFNFLFANNVLRTAGETCRTQLHNFFPFGPILKFRTHSSSNLDHSMSNSYFLKIFFLIMSSGMLVGMLHIIIFGFALLTLTINYLPIAVAFLSFCKASSLSAQQYLFSP